MRTVREVTEILRESYNWTEFCSPAPEATAIALETMEANAVAFDLHAFVKAKVAAGIPWNVAPKDGYEWACRQVFTTNQKFWELNTAQALGSQPLDPPVDTIGKAQSPTEWWNHQEQLRNRLGEKLCTLEEFKRRKAYANNVPLEWLEWDGGALIYQLAVREGYLPVGASGFDPAYLQTNPKLKDVRGLSATMWMENLAATDQGKPWPWLPTRPSK